MNSRSSLILVATVFAGLSGCATMSGDECATSDWSAIGYEDGARGYTSDHLRKHRKACAKHYVVPDFRAYHKGRDQGLVEYCQPSRGFITGSNGGRYNGVCSVELGADFLDAFNAGRRLHMLRSSVKNADTSIHTKERELKRIDDSAKAKVVALISDETAQSERVSLLIDIKDIAERSGQLESEIKELYAARARAQVKLEDHQLVVARLGY
jgi:hypothetical protein